MKIRAETINSKMTESERKSVISDLYAVRVTTSLLYVTPEQAATDFFKVSLLEIRKNNINMLKNSLLMKFCLTFFSGFIILPSTKK